MSHHRLPILPAMLLPFAAACTMFALSATARAQTITYVASTGNDANPCTAVTAPCKTLQRGINAVLAGGELRLLTSLQGNAVITKSVSIFGDGNALVGTIIVNSASAVVSMRGLALNGFSGFVNGIRVIAASEVYVENCTVENFTGDGILLDVAASPELFVIDSISRSNGADGLHVEGQVSTAKLTVDNSRFENNGGDGLDIRVNSSLTRVVASGNGSKGVFQVGNDMNVTWSAAFDNVDDGFNVSSGGRMMLESSVASRNAAAGLDAGSGNVARISNSVFTHNAAGIDGVGQVFSRGDNTIEANTENIAGDPLIPYVPQ